MVWCLFATNCSFLSLKLASDLFLLALSFSIISILFVTKCLELYHYLSNIVYTDYRWMMLKLKHPRGKLKLGEIT